MVRECAAPLYQRIILEIRNETAEIYSRYLVVNFLRFCISVGKPILVFGKNYILTRNAICGVAPFVRYLCVLGGGWPCDWGELPFSANDVMSAKRGGWWKCAAPSIPRPAQM